MGGMLGIGGNSAKTDRGNQLAATQGTWDIFNFGLPAGKAGQDAGAGTLDTSLGTLNKASGTLDTASGTLGDPINYYRRLLSAGRTDAASMSAPAVNATLAGADAQREQSNNFGTGRTGGTAAANASRDVSSGATIDNIISQTLQTGRNLGAQGLMDASRAQTGIAQGQTGIGGAQGAIGGEQLSNSLRLLGLSDDAIRSILNNSTQSRPISQKIHDEEAAGYGAAIGKVLSFFL